MRKKWVLFGLVAFVMALATVPAAAQTTTTTTTTRTTVYEHVYTSPPPVTVPSPPPSVSPYQYTQYQNRYCFTEGGYWRWDGSVYMWVPGRTVCRYQ